MLLEPGGSELKSANKGKGCDLSCTQLLHAGLRRALGMQACIQLKFPMSHGPEHHEPRPATPAA
jgi:hypothetical protein